MGRFVDNMIAYRILYLLVTPFDKTPAYKLGIIDDKGKELKKMHQLNTVEQRDAYSLLHRLVYRIKKIIEKIPIENKRLVSLAAAYSLIREDYGTGKESIDLEKRFINKMNEELIQEKQIVENYFKQDKMFTFKQFSEELAVGGASAPSPVGNNASSSVATNNVSSTPGIQTYDPMLASRKRKKDFIIRRK